MTDEGVNVGGTLVKALRFADDQAMLSSSPDGLQRMMDRLNTVSEECGMRINTKKIKEVKAGKGDSLDIKDTNYGGH